MSIKACYGWDGADCTDIIQVNYSGRSAEAYFTVKAVNPGIGLVLERIIRIIKEAGPDRSQKAGYLKSAFDVLSDKLGLEYDSGMAVPVLEEHERHMLRNPDA